MTTVMVTGVGAIIGYGVLRSLRAANPDIRLVGTDIYPDAVGQAWADAFAVAPYTSAATYSDWLHEQVVSNGVDLLIPAIEQDVDFLNDNRAALADTGCTVVVNTEQLIRTAQDKWTMDQELVAIDAPCRIESTNAGTFDDLAAQLGVPFLLKPRRGYASKGIVKVGDQDTFAQHAATLGHHVIAQRIVGSDEREYTISIFGDGTGAVLAMSCLRRRLAADGSTAKAVSVPAVELPGLAGVVDQLAAHFRPEGPTNLQFREVDGEWKLLEINPRISSSTSIRTAFGYNESAMCVEYYLSKQLPTQPEIQRGHAARYIEDVVVRDQHRF